MNVSMSCTFTLISLMVPFTSGTIISAKRRRPARSKIARKALLANIFIRNKIIPGREIAPIAAPMSVVLLSLEADGALSED